MLIGKSALGLAGALMSATLCAQESPQTPARVAIDVEQPEREEVIDLLAEFPDGPVDQRRIEQCVDAQDAASLSGEIVVCREIVEDNSNYASGSREAAQDRYAEETMFADVPPAPDVAGPGIFKGPATIGGLCIPGIQKCPPPPALMIDVTALPKAPPGSDADRIARGLPPLGTSGDQGREPEEVSSAGSEEPAEAQ